MPIFQQRDCVNNDEYEDEEVVMREARRRRDPFTLETSGFELLNHDSNVTSIGAFGYDLVDQLAPSRSIGQVRRNRRPT